METITVREWLKSIDMLEDSDRKLLLSILADVLGMNRVGSYSMVITVEDGKRAELKFYEGFYLGH